MPPLGGGMEINMNIFNIFKKPSENDKIFKEKFRFLEYLKYKSMGRALTDREIKKFESINKVSLPDDYKYFLTANMLRRMYVSIFFDSNRSSRRRGMD